VFCVDVSRTQFCICCRDGTFSSLLSMVDGSSGDYGFFGGMKNMWAGPSHWKPGFAGKCLVSDLNESEGS